MPEPSDLRLHRADGQCVITAGSVVLLAYGESDVVMRNLAISALRRLGFTGRRVAAVMGLTENYVATLHAGAVRDGSAALVRRPAPGRPGKLADQDWADAAAWRAQGLTDTEIGQRLGVAHTTVARHLGSRRKAEAERPGPAAQVQDELPVPVRDELPVPVRDELPVPVRDELTVPVRDELPVPVRDELPVPVRDELPVPVRDELPVPVRDELPVPVRDVPGPACY